ncbi:site-specific integrase [Sporolactobacillus sp. STSJ-5]|uniref:tyrosine-type recombinase/integrase n=1 Tax=Sporolactobacillus sp. STSJ-5 TaxID=2965076 RepID=UPI00210441DD|nr:site-specific integrase [Sporolactobacillus sp. STSJ-5]MCQ2009221.1 site-specific integrase [Sporolactobacillus sp. STSJ-5]
MASYRKLKSGWKYRITYYDSEGKQHEIGDKGFRTKAEARMAAQEAELQFKHGDKIDKSNIAFPVYMRSWYETFRKGKKSIRNDEDIDRAVRFAEEHFAGIELKNLDRKMYQKALNSYGNGHSTNSVSKRHIYMKSCLEEALQEGIIHRDPTFRVTVKGTVEEKDEDLKYISFDGAQKISNYFIERLDNFDYISRYMIIFCLATGCRFGEVLAVTWDNVMIDRNEDGEPTGGTVNVKRSWDYHKNPRFIPTKNEASRRVLPIDKTTCIWLDKLHAQQSEYFLKHKTLLNAWRKTPFVFVNHQLNHISNNAVNKTLKRACTKFDCTEITFHGLRHTFASILLYKKVSIHYVSRRLGHADIGTTLRIYAHVLDEMEQRDSQATMAVMDELFQKPKSSVVPLKQKA